MGQNNKYFEDQLNQVPISSQDFALSANRLYLSGKTLYKKFSDDLSSLENGINPKELPYLEVLFICLMLYGYAIENLLKSLLIKNGINLFQKGKLKKEYKTHDLNKLFEMCRLIRSTDEKEILDILSNSVIWAGRYPVPSKIQEKNKLFSSGKQIFIPENLYKRLLAEVEK